MKLTDALTVGIACLGISMAIDSSLPASGSLDAPFENALINHQNLSPFLDSGDALSRISDAALVTAFVQAIEDNQEIANQMRGNLEVSKRVLIALSAASDLTIPETYLLHSILENDKLILSLDPILLDELLFHFIKSHKPEALAPIFANPTIAPRISPKQVLQYIAYAAGLGEMSSLNFFFARDFPREILTDNLLSDLLKFLIKIKSPTGISNLLKNHYAINRIPNVAWENCLTWAGFGGNTEILNLILDNPAIKLRAGYPILLDAAVEAGLYSKESRFLNNILYRKGIFDQLPDDTLANILLYASQSRLPMLKSRLLMFAISSQPQRSGLMATLLKKVVLEHDHQVTEEILLSNQMKRLISASALENIIKESVERDSLDSINLILTNVDTELVARLSDAAIHAASEMKSFDILENLLQNHVITEQLDQDTLKSALIVMADSGPTDSLLLVMNSGSIQKRKDFDQLIYECIRTSITAERPELLHWLLDTRWTSQLTPSMKGEIFLTSISSSMSCLRIIVSNRSFLKDIPSSFIAKSYNHALQLGNHDVARYIRNVFPRRIAWARLKNGLSGIVGRLKLV